MFDVPRYGLKGTHETWEDAERLQAADVITDMLMQLYRNEATI